MGLSVDGTIHSHDTDTTLRLVSFNINGYKTLNHYHPWNELSTLAEKFQYLKADVITLQELKLQKSDITRSIASVEGYHSFITVSRGKLGYSGVGVFVRNDRPDVFKVIKAEEGITGYLNVNGQGTQTYRKVLQSEGADGLAIGGYTDNLTDWKQALKLDNEGRCIIVELNINLVIISLYCPANSMATEEEEEKRCLFLQTVLERVDNLKKMGKEVLVMGDINVAPSLIDRDDFMGEGLKNGSLKQPPNGEWFEKYNKDRTLSFRSSTPARKLLNSYLYDNNGFNEKENQSKILFDIGRYKNSNRLKMYTCWNTLKNHRPMNIGSRIDLFLGTEKVQEITSKCDIWAFLYGSDHCPIFCDIETSLLPKEENSTSRFKHFDAVNYYGLSATKSISHFFKPKAKPNVETQSVSQTHSAIFTTDSRSPTLPLITTSKRSATVPTYTSRKMQKGQVTLTALIQQKKVKEKAERSSLFIHESDEEDDGFVTANLDKEPSKVTSLSQPKVTTKVALEAMLKGKNLGSAPLCEHKEPSVLRVTKKAPNTGKRFWCCAKPRKIQTWESQPSDRVELPQLASTDDFHSFSCNFFKWADK